MWHIYEHRILDKICSKIPPGVLKKYELWKEIVFRHGPAKLRDFPGFHDEALAGKRRGQRSSRLSLQYRVIYTVDKDTISIYVIEITAHNY